MSGPWIRSSMGSQGRGQRRGSSAFTHKGRLITGEWRVRAEEWHGGVRLGLLHSGRGVEFALRQLWVSGGHWQGWW